MHMHQKVNVDSACIRASSRTIAFNGRRRNNAGVGMILGEAGARTSALVVAPPTWCQGNERGCDGLSVAEVEFLAYYEATLSSFVPSIPAPTCTYAQPFSRRYPRSEVKHPLTPTAPRTTDTPVSNIPVFVPARDTVVRP